MGRWILKVEPTATRTVAITMMIMISGLADPVVANDGSAPWVREIRLAQLRDPDGNILQRTTPIGPAPAPAGS